MCLPCNSGVSALVQRVYGDVQHCSDPDFLMERSVLTPRNRDVEDINSYMLHRWSGQVCQEQLRLQQQALCRPLGFMKGVCLFLKLPRCNMQGPGLLAAWMHTELCRAVAASARAS